MDTRGLVSRSSAFAALGTLVTFGIWPSWCACTPVELPGPGAVTPSGSNSGPPKDDNSPAAIAALSTVSPALPASAPAAVGTTRILLSPERLGRIQAAAKANTQAWRDTKAACDEVVNGKADSGYEAWDWAIAAVSSAVCFRASGRADYAKAAVTYVNAMIDDLEAVGDKKGGEKGVHGDNGYSIRTRGMFSAIAVDVLGSAPEVTPEFRKKVAKRLVTWVDWYAKDGYKHDEPPANYYMGYFGTVAMTGLAFEADEPKALAMRRKAREMWAKEITPTFTKRLAGGHWPEGWQYAPLSETVLCLYADAENRIATGGKEGTPVTDELPWIRQSLDYQIHSLMPDARHVFDVDDWQQKPPSPNVNQFWAMKLAFAKGDPAAKHAAFLAQAPTDVKADSKWPWIRLVADDGQPGEDPKRGATSYLAPGTGTFTARTDWTPQSVWFATTSGPIFGDHQHLDQGHFELARGSDWIVNDPGDYDSNSTQSHNAITVDDKGEHLTYAPNQGLWGKSATIARHQDEGGIAYVQAEYTSAYDNDSYPDGHPGRAVTRAEREFLFSRTPVPSAAPGATARLVVYDRFTVTKPSYGVSWLLHGFTKPAVTGNVIRVVAGRSAAWLTTLLPKEPKYDWKKEPTKMGDSIWYNNEPFEGLNDTRLELALPKGSNDRRALHAIVVGDVGAKPVAPTRIDGEGADGAYLEPEAYVFTSDVQTKAARVAYKAPTLATRHVIAGLAPRAAYAVTFAREGDGCKVTVAPGVGVVASSAGVVAFPAKDCAIAR
ncbi:MAG: heparinase II/III family protein [Polyangiaceae bacterium]